MSRMITSAERDLLAAGLIDTPASYFPRKHNQYDDIDKLYAAYVMAGMHSPVKREIPPWDPYTTGLRIVIPILRYDEKTVNERILSMVSTIPFNVFSKDRRRTIADIIVGFD